MKFFVISESWKSIQWPQKFPDTKFQPFSGIRSKINLANESQQLLGSFDPQNDSKIRLSTPKTRNSTVFSKKFIISFVSVLYFCCFLRILSQISVWFKSKKNTQKASKTLISSQNLYPLKFLDFLMKRHPSNDPNTSSK